MRMTDVALHNVMYLRCFLEVDHPFRIFSFRMKKLGKAENKDFGGRKDGAVACDL
jgi:hypothetical protein